MEICGLPCPPLDEEAFMPMTFDLSQFFDDIDDIDDEGNEIKKQHTGGRGIGKEMENLKQGCHPNQSCKTELNSNDIDPTSESKFSEKPKRIFSASDVSLKFESTKRKLHQAYEQVENARKRKAIKVIDFQPIPQQKKCPQKLRCGASSTKLAKKDRVKMLEMVRRRL